MDSIAIYVVVISVYFICMLGVSITLLAAMKAKPKMQRT